jgi:hypothetical protein
VSELPVAEDRLVGRVTGGHVDDLTPDQASSILLGIYEEDYRSNFSAPGVSIPMDAEVKVGSIYDSSTTYPASPASFTWDTDHWVVNTKGIYQFAYYVAIPIDATAGAWGYGVGVGAGSVGALTRYSLGANQPSVAIDVDGSGNALIGNSLVPQLYQAGDTFFPAIFLHGLAGPPTTVYGEAVIVRLG